MARHTLASLTDTIAAISTPLGIGGIGIVRLSGSEAIKIADRLFKSQSGAKVEQFKSHTVHLGKIYSISDGSLIDIALLTSFRSPHSFTGEDVVELSCHGGLAVLKKVLQTVIEAGARSAEPGEFSRRAVLNGQLSLTEAEAMLDLIQAKTEQTVQASLRQLTGELDRKITGWREEILNLQAEIEASLDFSEQELPDLDLDKISSKWKFLSEAVEEMLHSAHYSRILRDGFKILIFGLVNVGKSSLYNALLGENRAIVATKPGTTLDVLREHLEIEGIPVILQDAAGLKEDPDELQKLGIEGSKAALKKADLVVFVLDHSREIQPQEQNLLAQTPTQLLLDFAQKPTLIVLNKNDLPIKLSLTEVENYNSQVLAIKSISALTGEGLPELRKDLAQAIKEYLAPISQAGLMLNLRHEGLLRECFTLLQKGSEILSSSSKKEKDLVIISELLGQMVKSLDELLGKEADLDLYDRIFANFCIGK